ncbi:TRM11 family SAM-dependent methyltransferase [Saccharicrinis aurantiacus]|uniref:TRM11 family SAM-dependent methyltransferase n=1 Tax=Saccharicrinis aurantiacus TaxID=1849719 RepID=UPI002491FC52|nr:methyltransferase [Saccharicrinis aurantiacus]
MSINQYIYTFSYDNTEAELCKLESKYTFKKEEENRQLFSDIRAEPSESAYIKKRFDVITSSDDYSTLVTLVKKQNIHVDDFKVEYIVLDGDTTEYTDRLKKLKDIGFSIEGDPDYYKPKITYGLCTYKGIWYFGIINKDDFAWHKHNKKPRSFSNSINVSIAKALVSIAAENNKNTSLIDACCGVGTIMLEACFSGYHIEGCDINWKATRDARINLAHFNYTTEVFRSDIKDIDKRYDAAILDLPYNLYSKATDEEVLHIIKSSAEISDRLVIVSTSDITDFIAETKFKIIDQCNVGKPGKGSFARKVWVCEK